MAKDTNKLEDLRNQLREAAKGEVAKLSKLRSEHEERTQGLFEERDRLLEQQQGLQRQVEEVVRRINDEVYPERRELDAALSEAARDSGGRFLSDT